MYGKHFSTQCVYAQWAQADSFGTSLSPAMVLHIKLPDGEVRSMTVGDARKAIKVRVAQAVHCTMDAGMARGSVVLEFPTL
jgi:hypothetical protein